MKRIIISILFLFILSSCGLKVVCYNTPDAFGPDVQKCSVKDKTFECKMNDKEEANELLKEIKAGEVDWSKMNQDTCNKLIWSIHNKILKEK